MTDDNVIDIARRRHDAVMAELAQHRRERREQTELLVSFHRSLSSKLDVLNKRLDGMQDELVDTLKIELAGKTTPLESRLEDHADRRIAELLESLTARIEALEKAKS